MIVSIVAKISFGYRRHYRASDRYLALATSRLLLLAQPAVYFSSVDTPNSLRDSALHSLFHFNQSLSVCAVPLNQMLTLRSFGADPNLSQHGVGSMWDAIREELTESKVELLVRWFEAEPDLSVFDFTRTGTSLYLCMSPLSSAKSVRLFDPDRTNCHCMHTPIFWSASLRLEHKYTADWTRQMRGIIGRINGRCRRHSLSSCTGPECVSVVYCRSVG